MIFLFVIVFIIIAAYILRRISITKRISLLEEKINKLEHKFDELLHFSQECTHTYTPADADDPMPDPVSGTVQASAETPVQAAAAVPSPSSPPSISESVQKRKKCPSAFEVFIKKQLTIESVVTKLGILLLLIGIGYIFTLMYEKGVIREEYILLVGLLTGCVLTAAGFFVRHRKRRILAQVLFGGSIAVFYLTAFAAYVRYGFLDDGFAFIFLSLITISAYVLALTLDSLSVSVIALLASLFIPFIIDSGFFGLDAFGLYILSVALLSAIVYFFRRWRFLQFASILSLLSVLTNLLLRASFTTRDARLFLGLSAALWAIHTIPDFYVFLKGTEISRDKIVSPIAAVVNFGFTLFFGFKIIPYEILPPGTVYIFFTLLYTLLSTVCLFKDKIKTLGYAYIAGTLISAYISVIDRLQYDIEPAAVLGIAVFLYWLWRKDTKYRLRLFAHLMFFAGFMMLIAALEKAFYENKPSVHFLLQALLYFVPMTASVFLQKTVFKKGFQTLVFQVYVCAVLFALLVKILPRHFDDVCLLYGLALTFLSVLYSAVHYRYNAFFYEQSLYPFPFLALLFFTAYAFRNGEKDIVPMLLQCTSGIAFAGLSLIKKQNKNLRFVNRLGFYVIVLKLCLVDFYFFSFVFAYPLFVAAIPVLLTEHLYPDFLTGAVYTKKISKTALVLVAAVYYAIYAFARVDGLDPSIIMSVVNICNGGIALYLIYTFKPRIVSFFAVVTAVFVFFSITETYMRFENGGFLTLLWGFYTIGSFIFFLNKGLRNLVYTALVLILVVAAKLIFIDLHSLSVLSKAVTSSVFGAALLVLSYAVQPMLKRLAREKDCAAAKYS